MNLILEPFESPHIEGINAYVDEVTDFEKRVHFALNHLKRSDNEVLRSIKNIYLIHKDEDHHIHFKIVIEVLADELSEKKNSNLLAYLLKNMTIVSEKEFFDDEKFNKTKEEECIFFTSTFNEILQRHINEFSKPILFLSYLGMKNNLIDISDKLKEFVEFKNKYDDGFNNSKYQWFDKALINAKENGIEIYRPREKNENLPYYRYHFRVNLIDSIFRRKIRSLFPRSMYDIIGKDIRKIIKQVKNGKKGVYIIKADDGVFSQFIAEDLKNQSNLTFMEHYIEGTIPPIKADCDGLIFYNLNDLDLFNQETLWNLLSKNSYQNKAVVFFTDHSSKVNPIIELNSVEIQIPKKSNMPCSISILLKHLVFPDYKYMDIWFYFYSGFFDQFFSYKNNFYKIQNYVLDEYQYDEYLIKEAGFWFYLMMISENNKVKAKLEYSIKYLGDFWEIKFGTDSPILLEDKLGLYYIVNMLTEPEKKFDATEFVKNIKGSVSEKAEGNSVPGIRKSIRQTIEHIEKIEAKLSIGDSFALYLRKCFLPKSIIQNDGKDVYLNEDYFSDQNDTCMCKIPQEYNFQWSHISVPPYKS